MRRKKQRVTQISVRSRIAKLIADVPHHRTQLYSVGIVLQDGVLQSCSGVRLGVGNVSWRA